MIFEISWKNDVHNNYETDYSTKAMLIDCCQVYIHCITKFNEKLKIYATV